MTTITKWDPFHLELPRWMDRIFDDRPLLAFEPGVDKPLMRIEEFMEGQTFVVRAELPDVDIDKDVDISVHDGVLHIKAERTHEEEHKEKAFFRTEFRYGAFERAIPLPPGATTDDVKATYRDGVLEIRIPTSAALEAMKVPVQRVG
jgi:HSP20 family protein